MSADQHGMTGKRNAARASKPSNTSIEFRCTKEEKRTIQRKAKKAGQSTSEYCRTVLLKTTKKR